PSSNARANEEGVFVVSVEDKSPAKEAGLLAGDRLVEMSSPQFDISIVTMDDYTEAASRLSLASAIRLRIERSGRETYLLLDLNED
ncbi:MAG: PDZ domain-containing protein, partial [Candidatus Krumholzibacteria bacterium]|nr:PDZ domain-containing protein [Candidatus Krumholzibacteria bacterium]